MTKTWLMRRPVRSPASRATTAPSNSSVWRLPFMRSSACPVRTSSTAFAAAPWLCGVSTIVHPIEGESRLTGDLRDFGGRTDEDRDDQPFLRRLERAGKRRRFAGMHDRGRHRRERTAALQQLLVLACSGLSRHGVTGTNAGAGRRAAGPVSLRRSVRTIASATP